MKLIRCMVPPFQLESVVDALDAFDVSSLTVVGGGERCTDGATGFYRGCQYKVRLVQTSIIDITAPDDQVEGIVRTIVDLCNPGPEPTPGRILVMTVDEWHMIRPRQQRIAS